MHAVLARGTEASFVPESIPRPARRRLGDAVMGQARELSKYFREGDLSKIERRIAAFVDQESDPIAMRVHGDLHLGQILATPEGDFALIDFEGEPARSLAERKAKRSPLADVAGMLRSFHYAAATVLRAADKSAAAAWVRDISAAFLDAYGRAAHSTMSEEAFRSTLDFYLFEKCIYEIAYEANNRPDWIAIPQEGLKGVLDAEPSP